VKKPINRNLFKEYFIKEKSENTSFSPNKSKIESKKSNTKYSNIGMKKDINVEKKKPIKNNLIEKYFKKDIDNVHDNSNKTKTKVNYNDSIISIEVNKNVDLEKKKAIKNNSIEKYLVKDKENSKINSLIRNTPVIDLEKNDTIIDSYNNIYDDSVNKMEQVKKTLEKYEMLISDSDKESENNDKEITSNIDDSDMSDELDLLTMDKDIEK